MSNIQDICEEAIRLDEAHSDDNGNSIKSFVYPFEIWKVAELSRACQTQQKQLDLLRDWVAKKRDYKIAHGAFVCAFCTAEVSSQGHECPLKDAWGGKSFMEEYE